jgi:hypothetical protein
VAAAEPASADAALGAVESFAGAVAVRLHALAERRPAARAFARSLLREQEAHRAERDGVRRLLGLPPPAQGALPSPADPFDLEALRAAQEKLTYALAEAIPLLGRPSVVRTLARQMVAASRHLTLVNLWIEAEERRAS